jgi:hypothetical protein
MKLAQAVANQSRDQLFVHRVAEKLRKKALHQYRPMETDIPKAGSAIERLEKLHSKRKKTKEEQDRRQTAGVNGGFRDSTRPLRHRGFSVTIWDQIQNPPASQRVGRYAEVANPGREICLSTVPGGWTKSRSTVAFSQGLGSVSRSRTAGKSVWDTHDQRDDRS